MAKKQHLYNDVAAIQTDPHLGLLSGYGGWLVSPEQFDEVLRSRGHGKRRFQLYRDLERDAHISATLSKRYYGVIHRDWLLEPGDNSRKSKQAVKLVEAAIANLASYREHDTETLVTTGLGFDGLCLGLLDAILMGFAVAEIIWQKVGDQILPQRALLRPQYRFGYAITEHGYALRLLTLQNCFTGEAIPPRRMIVHCHNGHRSPYGDGLGSKLYYPRWFKREGVKWWQVFTEKYSMPATLLQYPAGTSPKQVKSYQEVVERLATDTGITLPEGVVLRILEANKYGSINCYQDLVKFCDNEISKLVLGNTGTTDQSDGGGSRARDEVASDQQLLIAKADSDLLAETLQSTLFRWVVELNLGQGVPIPRIVRQFPELEAQEDLNSRATRDRTVSDIAGEKLDKQYLVDTYGVVFAPEAIGPDPLTQLFGGGGSSTPQLSERGQHRDVADDYTQQAAQQMTPTLRRWQKQLAELVANATSFEELQEALLLLYGQLSTIELNELLYDGMVASHLAGRYEVLNEGD
jgi:phage gp29-like protein